MNRDLRADAIKTSVWQDFQTTSFESKSKKFSDNFSLIAHWRDRLRAESSPASAGVAAALERLLMRPVKRSALTDVLSGISAPQLEDETPVIFPFGSNAAQREAVRAALTHSVWMIEGPPGTGKTQTILNLIANLLLRGKTVAVAAPANAAADNAAEKLQAAGLGSLVARLGSRERREAFFASPPELHLPAAGRAPCRVALAVAAQELARWERADERLRAAESDLKRLRFELSVFLEEETTAGQSPEASPEYARLASFSERRLWAVARFRRWLSSRWRLLRWWARLLLWCERLSVPPGRVEPMAAALFCLTAQRREATLQAKVAMLAPARAGSEAAEERYRRLSDAYFREAVRKRYDSKTFSSLRAEEFRGDRSFFERFPVVTSSAASLDYSSPKGNLWDVLILDEAGQLDWPTAAAALACARSVVVAGDVRQLAAVIRGGPPDASMPAAFRDDRSFLEGLAALFPQHRTLLAEHYRCHPDIIEFCSRRFYGGALVARTSAEGRPPAIEWIDPGAQAVVREAGSVTSLRQAAVTQTLVAQLQAQGVAAADIGVIATYRAHARRIGELADTVHRFQGREKDVVIFNTVVNRPSAFTDDPRLINVAVSRARSRFILVAPACAAKGDTNTAALIRYLRHLDPEKRRITTSSVRSVFDALYAGDAVAGRSHAGESPAEVLFRVLLTDVLRQSFSDWRFVQEYPLRLVPRTLAGFPQEAVRFMQNGARLDFLVYDTLDNAPVAAFEVDGAAYHRAGSRQDARDRIKDAVLSAVGLPFLRYATDSAAGGEAETLSAFLAEVRRRRGGGEVEASNETPAVSRAKAGVPPKRR